MPLHEFSNGTCISTYISFKPIFLLKMCLFCALQAVHSIFNLQKVKKKQSVCVYVCVGGGGGAGKREREGCYFLYMVCRIAPFFNTARYIISTPFFFNKKYMTNPIFLDWYMKGPTFQRIDLSK